MAIDYANLVYGTPTRDQVEDRLSYQTSYTPSDYQSMYNRSRQGTLSGSAVGSADWLANYAQRNAQAQIAGMAPVNFNALLGPDGTVDPNAQVPNLPKTFTEIQQEAEARYLQMAAQSRDVARQSALLAGADQYSQARMAMEQQMALSDTRGLTAGAAEGARQTLSATQQVALNQIQSSTMQQLFEIDSQALQDPLIAAEYGAKLAEIAKSNNPDLITAEGILSQAQRASEAGNTVQADQLMDQYYTIINNTYGSKIPLTGTTVSVEDISDSVISKLSDLGTERTLTEEALGWAGGVLGTLGIGVGGSIAAGGVTTLAGKVGLGGVLAKGAAWAGGLPLIGKVVGVPLALVAGIGAGKILIGLAIAGAVVFGINQINKQINLTKKGESAEKEIIKILGEYRTQLENQGFDEATIEQYIQLAKQEAELPPKYNSIG